MHKPFRIERLANAAAPAVGLQAGRPARSMGGRERAALQAAFSAGEGLRRAVRELGEVVADTAAATHAVLAASEEIEASADRLKMLAGQGGPSRLAEEISECATAVMQACGFQDLAGQRIANVIAQLREMDSRLAALREVFRPQAGSEGDETDQSDPGGLENGPKLPSDNGHLTQAQVDRVLADKAGPRRQER